MKDTIRFLQAPPAKTRQRAWARRRTGFPGRQTASDIPLCGVDGQTENRRVAREI